MPNNWNTYKLGELSKLGDGAHSKVKRMDHGILYLTSKNFKGGRLKLDKIDYISENDYNRLFSSNSKVVNKPSVGDVLIGIIGTLGNAYLYKENDKFGISSSVAIIRPYHTKLDSKYLYYCITENRFKNYQNAHNGASVQGYTNLPSLRTIPINLPPLEEQKSIASILSAIDDKIENNLDINKTIEEMTMALYKHWFVDFGPFQDGEFVESELGMIPDGWEVKSLENIGDFKNGKGINAGKRSEDGKYIILGSNGIIGRTNEIMFKEPVIAIGRVGANYGEVHYSIEPCWISDNAITVQPQINNHYWFIYQILKQVDYSNFATGSAQPLITQSSVKALRFSCPDLESLDSYSSKIEILYNKRNENLIENQALTQLRDTLLPKLISGEIRIKDFQEQVENIL